VIKKFAIALVAAVIVSIGAGALLPRGWRVERQVVIDAPPERIYGMLFDLKRWQDWCVWTRAMDPLLRNTYEGPQEGVGAKWLWLGPKMGRGSLMIVAADPARGIVLDQAIESEQVNAHASISLSPEGTSTRVTWVDEGTLPPIFGGLFRATVEDGLAGHMAASLSKLEALLETPSPD
jgi:hypothetical protein